MWGILHFVCAILGFVFKVLKKKRQSFENVCKQLKKTVMCYCVYTCFSTSTAKYDDTRILIGGESLEKLSNFWQVFETNMQNLQEKNNSWLNWLKTLSLLKLLTSLQSSFLTTCPSYNLSYLVYRERKLCWDAYEQGTMDYTYITFSYL